MISFKNVGLYVTDYPLYKSSAKLSQWSESIFIENLCGDTILGTCPFGTFEIEGILILTQGGSKQFSIFHSNWILWKAYSFVVKITTTCW